LKNNLPSSFCKTENEIIEWCYDKVNLLFVLVIIFWLSISRFTLKITSKTKFYLSLVKVQKII
jgi:hypothetical protein